MLGRRLVLGDGGRAGEARPGRRRAIVPVRAPRPPGPDTRLRAWLFTILRNTCFSDVRKRRREVEDVDDLLAGRLSEAPGQEPASALRDFLAALATLPPNQREALVFVGGAGFSQEEAAEICGCAVGAIKSRVGRARTRVSQLLGLDGAATAPPEPAPDAAPGLAATDPLSRVA